MLNLKNFIHWKRNLQKRNTEAERKIRTINFIIK